MHHCTCTGTMYRYVHAGRIGNIHKFAERSQRKIQLEPHLTTVCTVLVLLPRVSGSNCMSQSVPASATYSPTIAFAMSMVHQNSKFHDSSMSKVKGLLNTVQICSDPEVESIYNSNLDALIGQAQERVIEKFGNDAWLSGECVSSSVPVDRRQKCKVIKSKSKPQ